MICSTILRRYKTDKKKEGCKASERGQQTRFEANDTYFGADNKTKLLRIWQLLPELNIAARQEFSHRNYTFSDYIRCNFSIGVQ